MCDEGTLGDGIGTARALGRHGVRNPDQQYTLGATTATRTGFVQFIRP